jgi:hypothetical protein
MWAIQNKTKQKQFKRSESALRTIQRAPSQQGDQTVFAEKQKWNVETAHLITAELVKMFSTIK